MPVCSMLACRYQYRVGLGLGLTEDQIKQLKACLVVINWAKTLLFKCDISSATLIENLNATDIVLVQVLG